jgi:hypothetical protein
MFAGGQIAGHPLPIRQEARVCAKFENCGTSSRGDLDICRTKKEGSRFASPFGF